MKLPFSLPFRKKKKQEYFLALVLNEEKTSAVIFEEYDGKIQIIGKNEEYLPNSIDNLAEDELLEILDKTISLAEEPLPKNIETQKTIFGLRGNWIEASKIKKDYLIKLKKISKELDLKPIGFLSTYEAIAHLLQEKEGAPVSAILVEVGKTKITVSIIRAGRIIETKTTKIEDSVSLVTDKILHQFTNYEILPSRIILLGNKDNEKLSQEFINHAWSKNLAFLHFPQISTLSSGFDAQSIVSGAATQMGFEVLNEEDEKILETEIHGSIQTPVEKQEEKENIIQELDKPEELDNTESFEKEAEISEENIFTDDFGFLKEKDVAQVQIKEKDEIPSNKNFKEKSYPEIENESKLDNEKKLSSIGKSSGISKKISKNVTKIFSIINPKNFLRKLKLNGFSLSLKNNKIFLLPSFVIILLISFLLLYIFFLKATITIELKPKIIQEKQAVVFSTQESTNLSENTILGEITSISQTGTLSTQTTGKKEVGEKAKGTITIYNSSLTEEKVLDKGTIIAAPNNIQFILDSSVKIASASGDASDITSSTAKVAVTAKEIGKESNLPSGTKFTIASLPGSIIIGKNESAFSGGSKKEIVVVSKEDVNKLLKELPENLQPKAKEELTQKIASEKLLLPIFINTEIEEQKFDYNVGDEAKNLTLTATIKYDGVVYKKSDLENLTEIILKKKYAKDLDLVKKEVINQIVDVKQENKKISANLNIKASLIPKVDNQKIISSISGKSFEETKNIILKLPQTKDVEITLKPNLPFLPKILPRMTKNINLNIDVNE